MAAECRYVKIAQGDQSQSNRMCNICGLGPCERYSAAAIAPTQPWRSLPAAEREPTKNETATSSSAEYRRRVESVELPRSFFTELVDLLYIADSDWDKEDRAARTFVALSSARNFGWKPQEERRGE